MEEDKRDMAHKKITGIAEKIGFHKKILDYDLSLNAADLLNKKDSSWKHWRFLNSECCGLGLGFDKIW